MRSIGSSFYTVREAIQIISGEDRKCKDAEIVFITDDCCEVSDSFLNEYRALKAERSFSTYSVLIGAPSKNAITLNKFSDEVISSFDLTEEVAGRSFQRV